ncbi:MAG: glutamine--fructose-6-phosphate transaminase (isomerizing) [Thermoprotei archaeon]|nr:MAG: glutamine--fructose-6-phosphate transaminase (isomerizing) [Thermoprotei archaeon]
MACGIIGVTARKSQGSPSRIAEIVKKGLEKLEYRGYDSVGVAAIYDNRILVRKGKGKISEVNRRIKLDRVLGWTVIGHTRWATHGAPSDINAHPHTDCSGKIAVVHNGIIQNYVELKKELTAKGHRFQSETDTEVLAHLIEEYLKKGNEVFHAFKKALKRIKGSYAFGVIAVDEPDKIFFARKDSPLVIGIGRDMNFIASDIPAFLEYTRDVIIVYDEELGYITPDSVYLEDENGIPVNVKMRIRKIDWTPDMAKKEGYPHFMIKEIHEQPRALRDTLRGLDESVGEASKLILEARKVYFVAAGTSYHACLVGDYLLNILAGIPSFSIISSEYKKYRRSIGEGDVVIAVSQSGETIDTLMAIRVFKKNGAKIISVSNVVDSAIPRESNYTIYTRAGPEIGVAATKTFTTQILVLSWLSLSVAEKGGKLTENEARKMRDSLRKAPLLVSDILARYEGVTKKLGEELMNSRSAFYLGRGIGLPIAMEGALKLKEIAYIHAEAYPAGESKHGPIALVEPGFPVVFLIFEDEWKRHMLGNIEEMKARGAYAIGIIPEESEFIEERLDKAIVVPKLKPIVGTIVYSVPLQLIAYYAAVARGYDPDKPRNLAKTVTVE